MVAPTARGNGSALHGRDGTRAAHRPGRKARCPLGNGTTRPTAGAINTWGVTLFNSANPCSSSRIIPTAPATASADSVRMTADVKFLGANSPKLANNKASQKTKRATNAFGVLCSTCWARNRKAVSPILPSSVIACPSHHWSRGSCRFQRKQQIFKPLE